MKHPTKLFLGACKTIRYFFKSVSVRCLNDANNRKFEEIRVFGGREKNEFSLIFGGNGSSCGQCKMEIIRLTMKFHGGGKISPWGV